MRFYGFQKMTLLDFPGKVACTLFTGGCNFRCPFCHNALLVTELDDSDIYEEEEILTYLKKRQGLLDGVCVTGGEPLLMPDLLPFLRKVKELGYPIKLDTNGSFPGKLKEAVSEGLVDYVAMDIKNAPAKYAETVGVADFDLAPVQESVDFLLSGKVDFEFRTTVVKEFHQPEDIAALVRWIAGAPRYFLQNFVDSGNLIGTDIHGVSPDTMREMEKIAREVIPAAALRGM